MDEFTLLMVGLGFLGLILISLSAYVIWELKVNHRKIRRAADADQELINESWEKEKEVASQVKALAGNLISAISALSGITVAAVFIVIGLNISGIIVFESADKIDVTREWIFYSVLAFSGIASIFWLLILEQLTQMKSPSISNKRLFKFHRYNYNLWFYGMILLLLAIHLFLLLAHPYLAMGAGVITALIFVRYWRIHNEWDEKEETVNHST